MMAEELKTVIERKTFWEEDPYFDENTRLEVKAMSEEQVWDHFHTALQFGTGGMREKVEPGTNRMNRYIVRCVNEALAEHLEENGENLKKGVVIAHDSRKDSALLSLETALVLAAHKIKVFLFEDLRPTPELSFAIRYLNAAAGVNITASHNTKEYNGYKIYGGDGAQLVPEYADQIAIRMEELLDKKIPMMNKEEAMKTGLLVLIGEKIDCEYRNVLKKKLFYDEEIKTNGNSLRIVYTPLHGAGIKAIPPVLQDSGFTSLYVVPEQSVSDGSFPTVKKPNPEDADSFIMALELSERTDADIAIASDPDCDRLGLYARDSHKEMIRFTGNEIGILYLNYLLDERRKRGLLPKKGKVVTSIASTDMAKAVAENFGVEIVQVPVGFKYIGEKIHEMEISGDGKFLFGFEESFGYLSGTHVRDKDAVEAALILTEMAWYYKKKLNKTLPDILKELKREFGFYKDEQESLSLESVDGLQKMQEIITCLRTNQGEITTIGGLHIREVIDYERRVAFMNAIESPVTDIPQNKAIKYIFSEGGFILVRPSGTEPKIKFYFCIKGKNEEEAQEKMLVVKQDFMQIVLNGLNS